MFSFEQQSVSEPAATNEDANQDRSPRVSFDIDLPIAKWDGKRIPPVDSFTKVQATNLSHSGMAFYSYSKPPSKALLLMMGSPKRPTYTSARVVRCTQEGGRYLVACEFVKRVQP